MNLILPDNINLEHPERYILTIRIHPEEYAFALYNPAEDGSYYYRTIDKSSSGYAFTCFKDFFFDHEWMTLPFRKTIVMNHTPEFTFIPSLIFEEKDKEAFMNFNFSESKMPVLSQKLRIPEITILHRMEEEVYEFFQRSFLSPVFVHHQSPLIVYFQEKSRTVNAHQLTVNVRENEIDILCFSRGEFILGNHFPCKQTSDAVYYILFIWKQLKLDQMKDFVLITGESSSKKILMEELKQYLRNIIPVNVTPEAHFAGVDIQSVPFELSALTLCEL